MLRVILFLVVGASIVAGGVVGRERLLNDGWAVLHDRSFSVDDCANYFVMRGLSRIPRQTRPMPLWSNAVGATTPYGRCRRLGILFASIARHGFDFASIPSI